MTILILVIFPASTQALEMVSVRWVVDGDTLQLDNRQMVRYIGINAPETGGNGKRREPYGLAAKHFHAKLIGKRLINLAYGPEKQDQYGRLLAYVYTNEGELANRIIVEQGWAYCLYKTPNIGRHDTFLAAQRQAMQDGKGIWRGLCIEVMPVIGNTRSKRFHKTTCLVGRKTSMSRRTGFHGLWEAFWEGYAPCKRCFSNSVFTK
jgi:micrococcal nuclease